MSYRCGLSVGWYFGFSSLRASEGYGALLEAGRGGADYRDFDYERINMYACMRAFAEVGYDGIIKPDYTPYLQDDSEDTRISWAFAIGQVLALRNALESGDP